ncbi:response regulator transcription factor [Luteibacter pinisoli]|uniref:Response regulator transcription factor n=1 Tax=Luteibacter pinisoli TaxID=2589080 RepID=A0A4Y5Z5B6_9GAMM|nr:response regulator transcription factor [Luteibacter pinisoli]QDE39749.1 response regulator transcription factor [Luteibacter pinisoli]
MTPLAIRVIVVDDHPLFRAGVVAMLAAEPDVLIVGQAGTGAEGIEAFRTMRPDVAVIDLKLPDMDGDAVVRAIRKIEPMARVIVLTTYGGDAAARRTLAAGAQGYLLKTSLANDLVGVVRAVHAGQHRVSAEVAKRLSEHRGDEPLTERELSVLRGVAAGLENKQIAQHLGIAADTVKEHLSHIMAKLRATNRAHALSIALARGYLA